MLFVSAFDIPFRSNRVTKGCLVTLFQVHQGSQGSVMNILPRLVQLNAFELHLLSFILEPAYNGYVKSLTVKVVDVEHEALPELFTLRICVFT